MTSHDDLIAQAEAFLGQLADHNGRDYMHGAAEACVRDLTAALKECREGGNEMLRLVILKQTEQIQADRALLREAMEVVTDIDAKFGTTKFIYEPARQRETLERLAPLTDTIIRARLVADKIKERLNG